MDFCTISPPGSLQAGRDGRRRRAFGVRFGLQSGPKLPSPCPLVRIGSVPFFDAAQIPGAAFIVDDGSKELMMVTTFAVDSIVKSRHRLTNPTKGVK